MTTKILQNGSDIRGIAISGVPGETKNLGKKETISLSEGYLLWLANKINKDPKTLKIAVGRDPRISGPALADCIIDTLSSYGAHVYNCDLASTPAMFMSTIFSDINCDGAIMITASHLPFNRNGFKYFDKNGGLNKSDIKEITQIADREIPFTLEKTTEKGKIEHLDLIDQYSNHLKSLIIDKTSIDGIRNEKPLDGMKIIVDAGNGGGGFYATKILAPLGADISDSQFLEPDGNFPNHAPNPEDKKAMASICEAVKTKGADFGLIFDTDVDRSSAVDRNGNPISRNEIVALAAALVAEDHPGSTVVTDSITSVHLNDFLENSLGLKHLRFKRGYKNVINKSMDLNNEGTDSQLAIETSGHAAFKENYFLDDGAYLATKIVIKAALLKKEGKTIDQLIADMKHPAESTEIRMKLAGDDFAAYGDKVLADMTDWVKADGEKTMSLAEPNYEGVRINFGKDSGNGWALLRKSLHDPIMPLNIESDQVGGCEIIAEKLKNFLGKYSELDSSGL